MDDFEKFLLNFFNLLSQMCFDKCRELIDKERESSRPGQLKTLLCQLASFIEAERSYFNLGFFSSKNKMFLRKEISLKSLYDSIRTEIQRIELQSSDTTIHYLIQFCQFLSARKDLITLYEQLHFAGISSKHVKYEEFESQVELYLNKYKYSFKHPILANMKNLYNIESEVLMSLLGAQVALQNWNLVQSIMHLQAVQSILCQWEKSLQSKETWKLGFLKGSQLPQLYQWLVKLKGSIVNKFTLYFYQTLAQQAPSQDIRYYISARHNTDFILKFQNLQRKCFASCALIVFDPKGLSDWAGPGYQHPARPKENSDQYIVMNSHPNKAPERLTTINKILSERNLSAMEPEKVISYYDPQDKCSFLLSNLDPRVTLVILVDGKKDERDSNINVCINEFCSLVRCTKLYLSLKINK